MTTREAADSKVKPRNWSRKTLLKEVHKFCKDAQLAGDDKINDLLAQLKAAVLVEEGLGDLTL